MATAYYLVAEALTNIAKYAHVGSATVSVQVADDALVVEMRDDGLGGATIDRSGSGGPRRRPDGGPAWTTNRMC